MIPTASRYMLVSTLSALIAACGGGGGSSGGSIENDSGREVALNVDANTQFFFREPRSAAADMTGFTLTRLFRMAQDDYVYTLDYIAAATANGTDAGGNSIRDPPTQ